MRQAHARLEQYEDDLTGAQGSYPALHAVAGVDGGSAADRSAVAERRARRRPLVNLDDDLLLEVPASGRGTPRRPTGAAASYARASTAEAPRRTVRISGHGAQTALRPTPSELRGPRPDRIAAWAVAFAIFLALLAALVGS